MIHYHGTPIGGPRQDVARFLAGRHALIPFLRPEDAPVAAAVCQSFALDNSAYSAWRSGVAVDFEAYLEWCYQWYRHPGFDFALIPDVIDGDEYANAGLVDRWPADIPGVPVWHLHEPIRYLEVLAGAWPRVAFGSSGRFATPGTPSWWDRVGEALAVLCDEHGRPRVKIHGLRMLAPQLLARIPFASADSTNAAQNAAALGRFGIYPPPSPAGRLAVIGDRIEAAPVAAVWDRTQQQEELELCTR